MVGVTVLNYTFDTTPLEYVTGVVTGEGILGKEELDELWGKMCIHLALLA
jgi:methylthioribose-1-phosphate isomerase